MERVHVKLALGNSKSCLYTFHLAWAFTTMSSGINSKSRENPCHKWKYIMPLHGRVPHKDSSKISQKKNLYRKTRINQIFGKSLENLWAGLSHARSYLRFWWSDSRTYIQNCLLHTTEYLPSKPNLWRHIFYYGIYSRSAESCYYCHIAIIGVYIAYCCHPLSPNKNASSLHQLFDSSSGNLTSGTLI